MKRLFCLYFFNALVLTSLAQTVLENNPPSLSWYQLNSPHFRILFPEEFDKQARRMADTLERLYQAETRTLSTYPRKITVVVQDHTSESNAFVSILPRRVEFFTMPTQDYNFVGNNDWLDLIATHEFRHVVQYDHANQGLNRLIYYITGNYGLSAMAALAVPQWFWEGDAVFAETAFTPSGRGEIPNFDLVFRTNLLEGRTFNYHKQYLRSYKNNIPNEYVLGYHMVSYLRKKTGDPMIWDRITSRAWGSSLVPFTFSNAIKKETGLHVTELYREMAADLKREWQSVDTIRLTASNTVNVRRTKAYTDYRYPQPLPDGSILAMKSGIGDISQLVRLTGQREEKIVVQGIVNETGMISAAGSRVVWNEYRFDPRWRRQNYSVIVAYDLATKRKWRVTPATSRYAGAALSPDGKQVLTLQTDYSYQHHLVILSVENGSVIKTFDNPENAFYSMARWSEDGSNIAALKTTPKGKAVVAIDVSSGTETELLPPSDNNIGYPLLHGSTLLYNAAINEIDNIFAYDIDGGRTYQLTSSRYGSYNPGVSTDGKRLYYNEQRKNGMDVVSIPFDPSAGRLLPNGYSQNEGSFKAVLEQESRPHQSDSIIRQNFPVTPYSKFKGIFNPYTWGPYLVNGATQVDAGFTSQDVLSTTRISAGYRYDINERTGEVHADISYQALYPIINGTIAYGHRKDNAKLSLSSNDRRDVSFEWDETTVSGGLSIPLLLTRSKYRTSLTVSDDIGYTLTSSFGSRVSRNGTVISEGTDRYVLANDTLYYLYRDITDFGQLMYNHFAVSYSHALKQSRRDFNTKFGQFITVEGYNTPFGGDYTGWQWAARGSLYFPGIFKHHSLYFRGGYQESLESFDLDVYTFRNLVYKPRGYSYPHNTRFTTFEANYAFPLSYPDIALGPILNIQRIKLNLFFDYGEGQGEDYYYNFDSGRIYSTNNNGIYKSAGSEITFDVNFFRTLPQFELGLRAAKREGNPFNDRGWVYEFFIGNIPF
jgi:WD40-like Beta Propeller Repeat